MAAQTLSSSVADAIQFLTEDVGLKNFENSAATVKFIKIIDRLFDICNSRNIFGKGYKVPLREANEQFWKPILLDTVEYLKQLKTVKGVPLHRTINKTPIKGFIMSLSLLGIFDNYVKNSEFMKYFLTYKVSQDHLELFFFTVR